jgi:hypothetical protein
LSGATRTAPARPAADGARARPSLLRGALAGLVLRKLAGPRWRRERAVETERFGIRVEDPVKLERIRGILGAFFSGLELSLEGSRPVEDATAGIDALFRPFLVEGAAMGVVPGAWLRLRGGERALRSFVEAIPPSDPHVILKHIGIGFWLGCRRSRLERAARIVAPEHRLLLHDGAGFRAGFFELPRSRDAWGRAAPAAGEMDRIASIRRLRALGGFARRSAMSGLGRSLWFFSMDRPSPAFETARAFGPDAGWVIGGLGLAAAYTFPDALGVAYGAAEMARAEERPHFVKGIRIALYARHENDPAALNGWIGSLSAPLRARAEADLDIALAVGARTRGREGFVADFHEGCLAGAGKDPP